MGQTPDYQGCRNTTHIVDLKMDLSKFVPVNTRYRFIDASMTDLGWRVGRGELRSRRIGFEQGLPNGILIRVRSAVRHVDDLVSQDLLITREDIQWTETTETRLPYR